METQTYEACLAKFAGLQEVSWNELAEKNGYGKNGEKLRSAFKRIRKSKGEIQVALDANRLNREIENKPVDYIPSVVPSVSTNVENSETDAVKNYRETTEINENGTVTSDRLIEICEQDSKSPESMLVAHKFDPLLWKLVSCKNNLWHMQAKNANRLLLYQSKITAKPKVQKELSFEDIDKYFKELKPIKIDSTIPSNYKKNGFILEIDIADLHVGNLPFPDSEIGIKERMESLILDILIRVEGLKLEKIILVNLGDLLHYDTYGGTTTGGTKLTTSLDFYTMFDTATTIMIDAIDRLSQIAPVELIGLFGNHDKTASYSVLKSIQYYFKSSKNVTVDCSHNSRKYRKFGNCLVGFVHGDLPKANIPALIQTEARKEYGETKFAEVHLGHIHSQQTIEKDGVIIRYLPSLAYGDDWHYQEGYVGVLKTSVSFLWDKEKGLQEMWFTSV